MIEPTGYTALDLIGFTDRGTYAANVNYVKNDLVHYGGSIWKILIDNTIGITPAEGPNYTIFMGEPSNIVERIIAPLEDNPATVAYTTGRQIIYNDYLYEVIDDIAVGDTLITYEDDPTNANIKLASPVETQVLALNGRMDTAENDINIINHKKIMLISDSYGVDSASGGTSWITSTINRMTQYTFTRSQTGGGGFGYDPQGTHSDLYFPHIFEDFDVDDEVGMVLILAGANDGNQLMPGGEASENSIVNGIYASIQILKTKFPNAKIHLGFVGRYRTRDRFSAYKKARNSYKRACCFYGISFADNFEYILHDRSFINSTDFVHPTFEGSSLISFYAGQYILHKNIEVHSESVETGIGADNLRFRTIVNNDRTRLIVTSSGDTILATRTFSEAVNVAAVDKIISKDFTSLICDPVAYSSQALVGTWVNNTGSTNESIALPTIGYILNGKLSYGFVKQYGTHGGTYTTFYGYTPTFEYDSMDC